MINAKFSIKWKILKIFKILSKILMFYFCFAGFHFYYKNQWNIESNFVWCHVISTLRKIHFIATIFLNEEWLQFFHFGI